MAYNEQLADRVRASLAEKDVDLSEKRMFGGLCFMVDEKMCICVEKDRLMIRIDPAIYENLLEAGECYPMDFTGKPMKGYVYVDEGNLGSTTRFNYWIELALDYNKSAKASPKKKK